MIKKALISISILLLAGTLTFAQELNCNVSVSSNQVQGSNKTVYETLRKTIYEFMNNWKWTDHIFQDEERIDCSLVFNIADQISDDEFRGTLQIQSSRPVFNTDYKTTLINYKDNDIHFRYIEFEALEYNEQMFTSNLVALLAYYANIILGMDYDTFSPEGGSLFFQRAEAIVNLAQNAPESGWKAFEGNKNRYWLVENLLNDKYSAMRNCLYQYHRMGLDRMAEVADEGRGAIAEALGELRPAYRENPTSMIWQFFFISKSTEIVELFSEAFPDEKSRLVQVLKEIDPANTQKWDGIMKTGGD